MNFSFFSSFFQKDDQTTNQKKSYLLQKIEALKANSTLEIFSNLELIHDKKSHKIILFIYDQLRGIYIFEYKKWSFKDLENATITQTKNATPAENTLAFDAIDDILKKKLGLFDIPLYHYLLMENLSSHEYESLNISLKKYLPKKNLIFKDEESAEIFKKLQLREEQQELLPSIEKIFSHLFIHYILQDESTLYICNQEQISFINENLQGVDTLQGVTKSGKSKTALLKAIKEIETQKYKKVTFIKNNPFAKESFQIYLSQFLKEYHITFDKESLSILTPDEFIHQHKKDPKLIPDLLICDDANFYSEDTLLYITNLQKQTNILLINSHNPHAKESLLTHSYKTNEAQCLFYQTNPYAKTLSLLSSLLQTTKASDLILVSHTSNRKKLQEDLIDFIEAKPVFFENISKEEQNSDLLLLTTYEDIVDIEAKYFIITDIATVEKIDYLYEHTQDTIYILYENECNTVIQLKDKYENRKK